MPKYSSFKKYQTITENFRQFINEGQWKPKGAKAMAAATGGSRYSRDKGDDETKDHWEPKGARDMAVATGGSRYSRDKGDDGGEIKEDAEADYRDAERREMGGPDYRGYPGHASSGPYDRYGDGIKYGTREYFIKIKGFSPEQADRAAQNLEDQRAAQDEANAEWRAMEKKQDEVSDRRHAAEIRKKMKQYPPKEPMRPYIRDLLDRFPEEDEKHLEKDVRYDKDRVREGDDPGFDKIDAAEHARKHWATRDEEEEEEEYDELDLMGMQFDASEEQMDRARNMEENKKRNRKRKGKKTSMLEIKRRRSRARRKQNK